NFSQQNFWIGGQQQWRHNKQDCGSKPKTVFPICMHSHALPNKPYGRNASNKAIGPKIMKYASSGNHTCPKVARKPTNKLPMAAPPKLPRPPIMTIARLYTRISASPPGYSVRNAPPSTPP